MLFREVTFLIKLNSCGYHFTHPEGITIDRPEGASDYAFVMFKTKATLLLGGQTLEADPFSCILFKPATPHCYRHVDQPFINDWFHCEGEELEPFLRSIDFPVDTLFQPHDHALVSRLVLGFLQLRREGGSRKEQILDLDLRSFFLKLVRNQPGSHPPEHRERYFVPFSRIRNEFYGAPFDKVSVDVLAARVNLSKSYFQHLYKSFFGCSVMHDIIQGRLHYAKYLLRHTRFPVGEIARLCGYDNETHFMRQFKKFEGVSPSAYRSAETAG